MKTEIILLNYKNLKNGYHLIISHNLKKIKIKYLKKSVYLTKVPLLNH